MKREFTDKELQSKAEMWCARGEHCEQEVRAKLRQWGCRNEALEDNIIDSLISDNFIDDERFCKAYVHDKTEYEGWGRMKIRMMLRGKRLPIELIEQSLETIDEKTNLRNLEKTVAKYGKDNREKTIRFALQRGFEYVEITEFLK